MKRACRSCRRPIDEAAAFCPACGVDLRAGPPRRLPVDEGRRGRPRLMPIAAAGFLALLVAGLLGRSLEPESEPAPDCRSLLAEARTAEAAGRLAEALRLVAPAGSARCGAEGRALAADLLQGLSLAHEHRGSVAARALRARDRSLADDPLEPAGLRARAELASRLEDPVTAFAWWEEAVDAAQRRGTLPEGERARLHNDAAVAAMLAGRPGRARLHLERALDQPAPPPAALVNAGWLAIWEDRPRAAVLPLLKALAAAPDHPTALAALAETERRLGRSREARNLAELALEKDADCLPALHVLALASLEAGERERAASLLTRALELAPGEGRLLADLERARR